MAEERQADVVVIGSGFGGTMVALSLARAFKNGNEKILMLERGTWWTTPVGTVADKEVKTADFLKGRGQPVQFWPSMDYFKGFLDILLRCVRYDGNEDGLYDFTAFGKRKLFGLVSESDGVMVLRASGVGGGSLVYSNITIQPPDLVFDDPRWPGWTRDKTTREKYYELARTAIGYGVVYARDLEANPGTKPTTNTYPGLHNIAGRSARIDPHFEDAADPSTGRNVKRLSITHDSDPKNVHWIDRARIFQTAMRELGVIHGTVDSAISDLPTGDQPYDPGAKPINYCERQGRCNVGCLPAARYTLNKQLMRAVHGAFDKPEPEFPNLSLLPLVEVDDIEWTDDGYVVSYRQRDPNDPSKTTEGTVRAKRVVLSAGCVGTAEILLRSAKNGGLENLSRKLGEGFSTNGDYIAFLENTDEHVSLTRGPVTTSFAHFNTDKDKGSFHTIEDQGIPKALASIIGYGIPFLQGITDGLGPRADRIIELLRVIEHNVLSEAGAYFKDAHDRQPAFFSEDEKTQKMMCVVGMGLESAVGKFTLGGDGETPLRVARADGKKFHEDPIYDVIRGSLSKLAGIFKRDGTGKFINPFLTPTADALAGKAIIVPHALGGCRMALRADMGVVDERGRVFDIQNGVYPGLYVADASIIPTALGANPSLTIAALSLRVADGIIEEMTQPH